MDSPFKPLFWGVIDWVRDPGGFNRTLGFPRYTVIAITTSTTRETSTKLVSRHRHLSQAQAFADKLNGAYPGTPPAIEGVLR